MANRRSTHDGYGADLVHISRTRRAQLVAEFEGDLGIDYKARAKAAEDERRWILIKTYIVWTIALMFFSIACQKLWLMGQNVDQPFSELNFFRGWF
jgi:hypothetical protein